jgi:hypothetical protein
MSNPELRGYPGKNWRTYLGPGRIYMSADEASSGMNTPSKKREIHHGRKLLV